MKRPYRSAQYWVRQSFTYVVGRCAICGGDVWALRRDVRSVVDPLLTVCQECDQDRMRRQWVAPIQTVGWTVRQ